MSSFLALLPVLLLTLAAWGSGQATWTARAEQYLEENMADYRYHRQIEGLRPLLEQEIEASPLAIRLSLYDFASGEWIGAEENRPVYPASMIKTLYLLAALEQVDRGALTLQETYRLEEGDKYAGNTPVTGSGLLQFVPAGNLYTLEELLSLMVSISDNVAANRVLDIVGPEQVAGLARRMGLVQTRATRKMYDLDSPLPSNRSTARELTGMLIALQGRQVCNEALTRAAIEMMEQTDDKGRIGLELAGSRIRVANKVGTVSEMIGDMALLYFPDRPPLALTLIIENPPSAREAADEIGRLAAIAVNHLKK